jgi:hypothetical protein
VGLKKLLFKPGVNRENTRYTSEGGFYDCDKIRFRQGTPEAIGGWQRISSATFLGICRSLWNWVTLGLLNLLGVGTNLKFYIERGGQYYDITPIRDTVTLTNPFTLVAGSTTVTVTDNAHGAVDGDFVTFSGATIGYVGGNVTAADFNKEFQITFVNVNTYTITIATTPNATDASNSPMGGTVSAAYQINTGPEVAVPVTGWGAGAWGSGTWGVGATNFDPLRLWSQINFGEDLIFGPRGGGIYYWDATAGIDTRAVNLSSLGGASDVPTIQNHITVSDVSRFVFAFGCNDYGSSVLNPMLIRWSDQESAINWTPSATNQAGSLQLSKGSQIVTSLQSRQEILVWTDSSLYSLQFLGAGAGVWGSTLLGDNISIESQNAAIIASGVTYWMGIDKFYKYDGRVQTLRCDLRQYIFSDINNAQADQIFAGTNEGFNEVWWFYCSANSTVVDKYVVYNYAEDIWYYGTLGRTAWLDSGLRDFPLAATYSNNLVNHEQGLNDNQTETTTAISAYIQSSEFDIDDGHNFGFIWRIVPDLTFRGSTSANPTVTMTLFPLAGSGSGYNNPTSVGGTNNATVVRSSSVPVEQFTDIIYVRVRGRQMSFKIESNQINTTWQLGAPRIDIRPDGRR